MKRILLILLTIFAVESAEVFPANRSFRTQGTVVAQQRPPRERRQSSRRNGNAERQVRHRDGEEENATYRTRETTRNEIGEDGAEELDVALHPLAETLAILLGIRNITNSSTRQLNYILSDEHAPSRRAILESLVAEAHRQYPRNQVYNSLWTFISALQQEPEFQIFAQEFTTLMCALTVTSPVVNPFVNILFRDVFGIDTDSLTPEIISLANTVCSDEESRCRYGAFIDMVAALYPNEAITQTFLNRIITRARSNQDLEAFFS